MQLETRMFAAAIDVQALSLSVSMRRLSRVRLSTPVAEQREVAALQDREIAENHIVAILECYRFVSDASLFGNEVGIPLGNLARSTSAGETVVDEAWAKNGKFAISTPTKSEFCQ